MSDARAALWESLERWSGTAFLAAGGCMLLTVLFGALDALVQASLEAPVGLAALVGIGLAFVGLLGLYPRIAREAPRLAGAGLLLVALPALYLVVVFLWLIPAALVPAWPSIGAVIPGVLQWAVFVLFVVGVTVFGVVSVRSARPSRAVGGFLLALAAAWYVVLGAELLYEPIPEWVVPALVVSMTVALLPLGYRLRAEAEAVDRAESASDSAA